MLSPETPKGAAMFPTVPLKLISSEMLVFELTAQLHAFNRPDREKIASAMTMAAFLHEGQTRKYRDGSPHTPYIEHPLRVALRLVRWGVNDGNTVAAALLHDTVEDCSDTIAARLAKDADVDRGNDITAPADADQNTRTSMAWLARAYGPDVADSVIAVTNLPWQNCTYTEKINRIAGLDSNVPLLIKLSDMCDNAGSLVHQHGHVSDKFVKKLLTKCAPLLPELIASAQRRGATEGVAGHRVLQTAATHAQSISDKLTVLSAEPGLG
ncbi:MAG: hypothetical protein DI630_00650 [Gordonia sp. (in: high G+C Gram-positive bacteria)]|nr:MAG: hypothetical protein DI630_00650 [Gordonia sp. (in: high G+C Gram-positive bacteria)]